MSYYLTGEFIEACDCRVICPCWVDQLPDNGSCTGFFAWTLSGGSHIDDVDVSGHQIVSVSTHLGARSPGTTTPGSANGVTVLYLTAAAGTPAHDKLIDAFTGQGGGPLADIVAVIDSPPLTIQTADITIDPASAVTVTVAAQSLVSASIEPVLGADGAQTSLAHQHLDAGLRELEVARNTAMDIAVPYPDPSHPVLGDTYLFDFGKTGYSASSGHFDYRHP